MRALTVTDWLEVWERGDAQSPTRRALMLLAAACDDMPPEGLVQWSIGQRDAALLRVRESLFGEKLLSRAVCPHCGGQVEFSLVSSELLQTPRAAPIKQNLVAKHGPWRAKFRLLNSLDFEALDTAAPEHNGRALLARCLVDLRRDGSPASVDQLPPEVETKIAARMREADPQAELSLDLVCGACGHCWKAIFDTISYFWSELHAWAVRLLRDVHALASAYGWAEADILALSGKRRQFYLRLLFE
jgi:hypothetical protein